MSYYDDEFVDELTDERDRLAAENKKLRDDWEYLHRQNYDEIDRYFVSLKEWGKRKKELLAELQSLRERGRQVEARLEQMQHRERVLLDALRAASEEVEGDAAMFGQLGHPVLHRSTHAVAQRIREVIDAATKGTPS